MKNRILLDVVFYLAIPLLAWNFFRELWGDYYTILFGMVPGLLYTIISFIVQKEWNVTGVFFLSLITLNFTMNLFSHTAEQELWNAIWVGYISIAFYMLTILVRRPIGMYFFVDYAYAKGVPREHSKSLYLSTEYFHYFIKFTLFLVLREVVVIVVKTRMILTLGVEGFNAIQVATSVINYIFTALTVLFVVYIVKKIVWTKPDPETQPE
ncbi:MAG: hypothetical protein GY732_01265 [Gammaproteobacteria bacterium]|nr:hypothetical protein [Gammaproteobacteria bacterium]